MAFGFFDGQKADSSPESIKRKRAMIAKLLSGGRAPRNIGEGFSSIGDSVAAAMLGYQADTAEKANEAERSRIMAPLFGGGGAPMAAVGGAPVATGAVSGKGYDNPQARETYEYALTQGLAPHQAAAYTSAKLAESRFDPNARNPGDGRDGTDSIGVFQWNSGRAQALKQFAAQQGKSWNDPAVQRAFSFAELNGSERAAGQALRGARNMEEATAAMLSYLRPGGWTARNPLGAHSAPARLRNTQGILSAFGGTPVARPIQTASAGPQSNDAQMQDGAGELQAGGSEMMGGGYNPFLLRDMAPPADAMGQGIADNEEQTRIMEAQMAAEQGLPYAGNEPALSNQSDVFSPVPMGLGPNPFLPREPEPDAMAQAPAPIPPQMDRATFDAITGQMPPAPSMDRRNFDQITSTGAPLNPAFTGEQAGLAPSWGIGDPNVPPPVAQEVSGPAPGPFPTPPRRPANLGPQSPFVPPAMRQPMSMDFGGENSGGAMQFIESEFARREGRPDPRSAIGAPPAQIYNAFVPPASQMPAGGGFVQGVSQGDTMASGPAQAPAQAQATRPGMIPERDLVAVLTSGLTTDTQKKFAMDTLTQQRAIQQAEAERARVQAQNRQTARDLGIPESLGGVGPVVTARAQQMFGNKTENIPATVAAREAEGRRLGLQGSALQNFALTGQMPVASQDNLDAQVAARKKVAEQNGLKPGDPRYEAYVLTGNMPRQNDQPLSVTDRKIIVDAEDSVINFDNTISILARAKELNPKAYSGFGAGLAGTIGTSGLPGANLAFDPERAKASREFNQLMSGQAIEQMAQTLKGATTEFELKQFVEILGDPSTPPDIRARTIDRMTTLAQRQRDLAISRAKDLRNRDYFKPEDKRGSPSGQTNAPAQGSKVLRYNPATGALE